MPAWSRRPGTLSEEVKVDMRSADEGRDEASPVFLPGTAGL